MDVGPARQADVAALARLWHAGWHQAHARIVPPALVATRTPAEFEARVRRRVPQTRVMRAPQGRIAGFFILEAEELYQFYIAQPFQGQGAAGVLMRAAEAALGPVQAWLACSVGNDRAARFYERCGWAREGVEAYAVETAQGPITIDVWRYQKDLRGRG
jgi:GNAT superfamily N-acetyltransferase